MSLYTSKSKLFAGLVLAAAIAAIVPGRAQTFRSNQEARVAAMEQEQAALREEEQGRGGGGAPTATPPEPMKFRYMGPAPAGRISAVVGVNGDPKTYYLGNASGGVWKTVDGGTTFKPIFDDQPSQAIGAMAIA